MTPYPTLQELQTQALDLAQTYEINWDMLDENSENLMNMKRLLLTMEGALPELEKYYTTLTSADQDKLAQVASSMGIHQYTGLVLDIQDELLDAYACQELMAKIDGVQALTG